MKKFLLIIASVILMTACVTSLDSEARGEEIKVVEVQGRTIDAVLVTVQCSFRSSDGDAEWKQTKAILLALAEVFVEQIYTGQANLSDRISSHNPSGTILGVKVVLPPDVVENLKK